MSSKGEGTRFSIFPSFFLSAFHFRSFSISPSRAATQSYLERQVLLPISQRDVGSIPDRRDHRAHTSKCTFAIFGGMRERRSADREVVGRIERGDGIPISTKYEIWKISSTKISAARVPFTSHEFCVWDVNWISYCSLRKVPLGERTNLFSLVSRDALCLWVPGDFCNLQIGEYDIVCKRWEKLQGWAGRGEDEIILRGSQFHKVHGHEWSNTFLRISPPSSSVTIYLRLRTLLCSAPIFWLADRGPAYFYYAKLESTFGTKHTAIFVTVRGKENFLRIYSDVKRDEWYLYDTTMRNNWHRKIRF